MNPNDFVNVLGGALLDVGLIVLILAALLAGIGAMRRFLWEWAFGPKDKTL